MHRTAALLTGVALALSASSAISAAPPDVPGVLRQWSVASASVAPPGKSARQRVSHKYRAQFSGHEIALILEFRGPVDAKELLNRYRFTKAIQAGKTIRLTASPKDNVERLFFSRFELTLDALTHLPVSISFTDRSDRPVGAAVTLFTDRQRQRITLADEPIEAPVPNTVRTAAAESTPESRVIQAAGVQLAEIRMPSLIGLHWKSAKEKLERAGYRVRLLRGKPASNREQVYHVYRQQPNVGEPLSPGTTIDLTLFDKSKE